MNIAIVNIAQIFPLADSSGMMGGFGLGWMIVMVLFWAAIILGVVWLIRSAFDGPPGGRGDPPTEGRRETPTQVLERRFAEGAISPEDYRVRREVLVDGGGDPNGAHKDAPLTAPRAGEGRQ